MKSRDGKSQREDQRRERVRRKKMQMREKVDSLFFQWFVAPEGRKVGSLKRRVRSHLARWEMKDCTPLWREAHFEVKTYKTHQLRTTFGSWDVEKAHAILARSTCRSQNVQSTPGSDHFWKLRCRKNARRCGAKHISKSKCTKHTTYGPLLDVQRSFRVASARDCAPCQKWAKREGFVTFPKTMAGVGHWKGIFKDAFRVAGAVQKTCSEMLGGQGADFLRGVAFWSIRSSGLLRWFCVQVQHFVRPGITFSWQAQYFRQVEWKNRKTYWYEAASSALNFPFLKEVSQNCLVFDVVKFKNSKNEEVSQNCFVFDVVNVEKWGSLAELLRFWCCQLWKMKKSRRIARLSSLQIRQTDRKTDRQIDRQTDR